MVKPEAYPHGKGLWAVTVKLPKNSEHDPSHKKIGQCPFSGLVCTDITGEHHTVLTRADTILEAEGRFARKVNNLDGKITRCEHVKEA